MLSAHCRFVNNKKNRTQDLKRIRNKAPTYIQNQKEKNIKLILLTNRNVHYLTGYLHRKRRVKTTVPNKTIAARQRPAK